MRIYEQSIDQSILLDLYRTGRLDRRSFSRLTKEVCDFVTPFDVRFRDMMVNYELPIGKRYAQMVSELIEQASTLPVMNGIITS